MYFDNHKSDKFLRPDKLPCSGHFEIRDKQLKEVQ